MKNQDNKIKKPHQSIKRLAVIISTLGIIGFLFIHLYWIPMLFLRDLEFNKQLQKMMGYSNSLEMSKSEQYCKTRSIMNRIMVWSRDHNTSIILGSMGDRTSVPYLIWSLPNGFLGEDESLTCIYGHSKSSLRKITNQRKIEKKADWIAWYVKNWSRSTQDWWADGFRAAGYNVSTKGDSGSIHELFRLLGQKSKPEKRNYDLENNALRMLECFDRKDVVKAIGEISGSGNEAEENGAAAFWQYVADICIDRRTESNISFLGDIVDSNSRLKEHINEHAARALCIAAKEGADELILFLLKKGVDVNVDDPVCGAPLSQAVAFNKIRTAEMLLAHGASVNKGDRYGNTPLHIIIGRRFGIESYASKKDIVTLLLSNGAMVNAIGSCGNTPLHMAVVDDNIEIVKLLLSKGPDLSLKNKDDMTALDIAVKNGYREIEETLKKYAADRK